MASSEMDHFVGHWGSSINPDNTGYDVVWITFSFPPQWQAYVSGCPAD